MKYISEYWSYAKQEFTPIPDGAFETLKDATKFIILEKLNSKFATLFRIMTDTGTEAVRMGPDNHRF